MLKKNTEKIPQSGDCNSQPLIVPLHHNSKTPSPKPNQKNKM